MIAERDNEYDIRIADFGLSDLLDIEGVKKLDRKCGSPGYTAPEILKGMGYDTKADIFSLGSVFFNLLTGKALFPAIKLSEVLILNKYCNLDKARAVVK